MSVSSIEAQFDIQSYPVFSRRDVVIKWIHDLVFSFRFVRVTIFVCVVFLMAGVFYGVENQFNPIYAIGRNISSSSNVTSPPASGIPTGLSFIDALFVSTSLFSNTGLTTVDFSLWIVPTQALAMVCMIVGCLPMNTMYPVLARVSLAPSHALTQRRRTLRKALLMIIFLISVYMILFCFTMAAAFAATCSLSPDIASVFQTATPPVNPWFGSFFIAFAAFTNCGFSPLGASVVPLASFSGIIVWLCCFIIVGNIGYPALLRSMFALMESMKLEQRLRLPMRMVRRNPRAFYQMLFPVSYLLFLSALWAFLYIIQWALLMGLEWNNTMSPLLPGQKLTASIFTTVTTRTAGLNVVATGALSGAVLVMMVGMFVISSSPNAIAMKVSSDTKTKSAKTYTTELLVNVVIGLMSSWVLILVIEYQNPWVQNPFPTLFEIASAFGTVGLSMGFGTSNASLSGAYSTPSKIVIIILMTIGAHRSLPENIDSAIDVMELPSDGHVFRAPVHFSQGAGPSKMFMTKANQVLFGSKKTLLRRTR